MERQVPCRNQSPVGRYRLRGSLQVCAVCKKVNHSPPKKLSARRKLFANTPAIWTCRGKIFVVFLQTLCNVRRGLSMTFLALFLSSVDRCLAEMQGAGWYTPPVLTRNRTCEYIVLSLYFGAWCLPVSCVVSGGTTRAASICWWWDMEKHPPNRS